MIPNSYCALGSKALFVLKVTCIMICTTAYHFPRYLTLFTRPGCVGQRTTLLWSSPQWNLWRLLNRTWKRKSLSFFVIFQTVLPVYHHGSKLPVRFYLIFFVFFLQPSGHETHLLEFGSVPGEISIVSMFEDLAPGPLSTYILQCEEQKFHTKPSGCSSVLCWWRSTSWN